MKQSSTDSGPAGRPLLYRCLRVIVPLLVFVAAAPVFILKLMAWAAPSVAFHPAITLIACGGVVLIGASIYLLFHAFVLEETVKKLEDLADLGKVSAQVAHDMRGPLSCIRALTSALAEGPDLNGNESRGEALRAMGLLVHRLGHTCEDLLAKQRGTQEPIREFGIHTILDELVEETQANRSLAGISFRREYDPKRILLSGRQNRLQRVFANIIRNGMEAMKFAGEISIFTTVKGDHVIVSIRDAGPGMSREMIERILTTGGTEGKVKGNGIGMACVREVICNHNGQLSIDSSEGKGTTVHVQLPYRHLPERISENGKEETRVVIGKREQKGNQNPESFVGNEGVEIGVELETTGKSN